MTLPASGYMSDNSRTEGEMKTALEDLRDAIDGGVAEAFVEFDGSVATPVPGNSKNVSSITDDGVGQYVINLTTALAGADYVIVGMGTWQGSGMGRTLFADTATAITTSSFRVVSLQHRSDGGAGQFVETDKANVAVFRSS